MHTINLASELISFHSFLECEMSPISSAALPVDMALATFPISKLLILTTKNLIPGPNLFKSHLILYVPKFWRDIDDMVTGTVSELGYIVLLHHFSGSLPFPMHIRAARCLDLPDTMNSAINNYAFQTLTTKEALH